ncbi:hypothetical protein D0Z08_04805 [Nocardioides immobilis]|uniref:Conjugal transfer protein n=1 Tax=Nocardioides immobilis TaxID=2049295 RepID=A0A417Y6I6_9ACTN|nr:hypothetical protein [Nocardioides immobilis]RHW28300.1 hypothetical protein D0Z08_04805 [Nocardioides immobilis]
MQRERRRDPYPWTWEIPVLVIGMTLLVMVIGIQMGRSTANLLAGAGWTWPDTSAGPGFSSPLGTAFWTSLPGVVTGHAEAGLPTPVPVPLAGPSLVWTSLALTEAVLLTATTWIGAHAYQRWGPGRMRGMATSAEAAKLLGITRLRKVSWIVRPDLYGKHVPKPAPVARDAGDTGAADVEIGCGMSPWLVKGRSGTSAGDTDGRPG